MSRVSRTVSKTVIHTFSRLLLPFDQRLLSHYWTAKEFVHEFYQRDGKWWHPPPHSLLILLDISLTSGVKHQWDVDKMNLLTPLLPAMAFTLFLSLSRFMPEARNYNWWWERDQQSMWDPWVSLIKNTQQKGWRDVYFLSLVNILFCSIIRLLRLSFSSLFDQTMKLKELQEDVQVISFKQKETIIHVIGRHLTRIPIESHAYCFLSCWVFVIIFSLCLHHRSRD